MVLQSCDVADNRRDHAVRELGKRGGQARRAYLQGGRSLQGDGVQVVAVCAAN